MAIALRTWAQDTTDFTFTIALNGLDEYKGGGTLFPTLRPHGAPVSTLGLELGMSRLRPSICWSYA